MFIQETGRDDPTERRRGPRVSFDQKCIDTCALFEKDGGSGAFMAHLTDPANTAMHDLAAGFYSSAHLETILTQCYESSEKVRARMDEWARLKNEANVKRRISNELDDLKKALQHEMKDVTADYLVNFSLEEKILPLLERCCPFTRDLIICGVQTDRASKENMIKLPDIVRSFSSLVAP